VLFCLVLAACGEKTDWQASGAGGIGAVPAPTAAVPGSTAAPASTSKTTAPPANPAAHAPTVELGDAPEVAPVERMLSALTGRFDAALFASAFGEVGDCDLAALAVAADRDVLPLDVFAHATAKVTRVRDGAAVVEVTVSDSDPTWIPVHDARGEWLMDGAACDVLQGADTRASDRASQSDLRNALTAAKVWYVDTESYEATPADLATIEPSLNFDALSAAGPGVIGFTVESPSRIILTTQSASGTWFCLADDASAGTFYGQAATKAAVDTFDECQAPAWQ
jgi:hypothetical protein